MKDYKKSGVDRNDFRHTKIENEVPKPNAANTSKNTKKWCKGKVGVEHKPKCMPYTQSSTGPFSGWKVLVCETCGKKLDHYYPMHFNGEVKSSPPDWVK